MKKRTMSEISTEQQQQQQNEPSEVKVHREEENGAMHEIEREQRERDTHMTEF
jgi:hypothetical protein